MKRTLLISLVIVGILAACASKQKITGLWSDREAIPASPYKSAFIMVMTADKNINYSVESQMAKVLRSMGLKAVKSNDIFPPDFSPTSDLTKEQLSAAIKRVQCDAVLTIALLDTKITETYNPGSSYSPLGYAYNNSYYGYYNYYYPQIYTPGYYTSDKKFYIECNLYDLASEKLLWSVQSEAYNPDSLESWFKGYSEMLIKKLRQEGLIKR